MAAIARRQREGAAPETVARGYQRLTAMEASWLVIHASDRLQRGAIRCLKTHSLRAGDALHVAAALIASDFEPANLRFLTQDKRLREVAGKEGFEVD